MNEIFKPVKNFEGLYEVSSLGRVKSLKRKIRGNNNGFYYNIEKIKKFKKNRGYVRIGLWKNGKAKYFCIHRLVGNSFIPNINNKPEINHLNGIKTDNRVENLEWVTRSENELHAFKIGLKNRQGDNHYLNKLNSKQVGVIRHCHSLKMKDEDIAKIFLVHRVTINRIRNRKAWIHID